MDVTRLQKICVSRYFSVNNTSETDNIIDFVCKNCNDTNIGNEDFTFFRGFTKEEQQESIENSNKANILVKQLNTNLKILKTQLKNIKNDQNKVQKKVLPSNISLNKNICTGSELNSDSDNNIDEFISNKLENLVITAECLYSDSKFIYSVISKVTKPNKKVKNNPVSSVKEFEEHLKVKVKNEPFEVNVKTNDGKELVILNPIIPIKNEEQTKCLQDSVKNEIQVNKLKTEIYYTPRFIPPKSPHNLIEEDLYYNPWALLVATIFLNKTSCQVARPFVFWFLEDNPSPEVVLKKTTNDLEKYFVKLGLQKTRATQIWRMSQDFLHKNWKNARELYGIGRYGQDAYRMFCLGDFSEEPRDRYLKIYKAWFKMTEEKGRIKEMNS